MPALTVVGAGRVGRTLAALCVRTGASPIAAVLASTQAHAEAAVRWIGAGLALTGVEALRGAERVLLAVPDDALEATAQTLAQPGVLAEDAIVFHVSGAKASSLLRMVLPEPVAVASAHPVRSFADPDACLADFPGTPCCVEGEPRALAYLEQLLPALGAEVYRIDTGHKLLYHAAAVFASNYLVTLMDLAQHAYQASGLSAEAARALAGPLARATLENVLRMGPEQALTGPIARGDWETVQAQEVAVLDWDALAGNAYRALIAPTARLSARRRDTA